MVALIGHSAIRRELRVFAAGDDPPHALLLCGPPGTGRTALALEYASLLNCDALAGTDTGTSPEPLAACGSCRACRLIGDKRHPDLLVVGPGDAYCRQRPGDGGHERHPESRDIRICQVRGIIDAVSRYPLEGSVRTVIIEPAERLGRDAAHALLKTLEEPPDHTVLILVTAAPEAILETIRSRCRTIDVRPVARHELEDGLLARGVAPDIAAKAASQARGRPVTALAYASSTEEMEVMGRLLERCRRVAAETKLAARLSYAEDLAERWRRDRDTVLPELAAWEAFWEEQLLRQAADGEAARGALNALVALTQVRRDLMTQVLARPLFEAMLLGFPTVTLDSPMIQETAPSDA